MTENITATEIVAAEVPAPAPAPVELPAWRTLPDGYVLKDRDILANCKVREDVQGVVSQKWSNRGAQLHADGSACLKVQNPKSEIKDREWLLAEIASESARQQAGQE